jgi:ADP-ribose pyrophosphatase YjhB (NUDIX family)
MTKYHYPAVAVDVIVEKENKLLLIRRKKEPYQYCLAIPGGFINEGERVEDAATREIREETNLEVEPKNILGVYSTPHRDPRGHVISVVFVGKIIKGEPKVGDDADNFEWLSVEELGKKRIAFDHAKILEDYQNWKVDKGTYWSSKQMGC